MTGPLQKEIRGTTFVCVSIGGDSKRLPELTRELNPQLSRVQKDWQSSCRSCLLGRLEERHSYLEYYTSGGKSEILLVRLVERWLIDDDVSPDICLGWRLQAD